LEDAGVPGVQSLRVMSGGHLCPDHLDLVAAPGETDVTVGLVRSWLSRPGGRLIDLRGVRAGSALTDALPGPVRRQALAVAPWASLPENGAAFMATFSSQFRRQLRRASARLFAEGATHRVRRGPEAVSSLDTLRRLHQAQWGGRSQFLPEFDRFAAACRLGAEADEVVVHELATAEAVLSIFVTFEVAGRVSLYQSARLIDPHWREASTVLLSEIFTDACDRGLTEVDFLRGDEPYKHRFAPMRRELFTLAAAKGPVGRAALSGQAVRSSARLVAERSLHAGREAWRRVKR
jgi:CelD/BcsL family acetyltransferase involved in cellulose biosynthesis